MIKVSEAWKEANKQMILPESFVEISVGVINTSVDCNYSVLNSAEFSSPYEVMNGDKKNVSKNYALLEHNLWTLDGSMEVASTIYDLESESRYVSADDDTSSISLNLFSEIDIPGVTIIWSSVYNEYATSFRVRAKNNGTILKTVTVTDNKSVISTVDMPVSGVTDLEVQPIEWSVPDHRRRVESIKLGYLIVFDKNQIISYTHEMTGNPLGAELSRNSIEFEVDNSDGRWNIMNPDGMAKHLYERQRLTVHYGLRLDSGVEWIHAGVFYLSEWKAPANGMTATFVARDTIEFMQNATYKRDYLQGVTTSSTKVFRTMDDAITRGGEVGTGTLITTLQNGTAVKIYEQRLQAHKDYEDAPGSPGWMLYRIAQGWVSCDNIEVTSDTRLSEDFFSALWGSGLPKDLIVAYSHDLTMMETPISVKEIVVSEFLQQCAAGYAIPIWQRSNGKLWVYPPSVKLSDYIVPLNTSYSHPNIELGKPLKQINLIQCYRYHDAVENVLYRVGDSGETVTVTCPYLWKNSAQTEYLANCYARWLRDKKIISGEFRADPRLELFDVVSVETKYGLITPVMLTGVKYTFNGSFRCEYVGETFIADTSTIVTKIVEPIPEDEGIVEEIIEEEVT